MLWYLGDNVMNLRGKNVAVVGLGERTGLPLIKFLLEQGAQVFLSELNESGSARQKLKPFSAQLDMEFGAHSKAVYESKDLIITSPGVPADIPVLMEARRRNVPVWSELELAFRYCQAPFVAITGTNGKTTVTTLLGAYLGTLDKEVVVAGNIGTPLIDKVTRLSPHDLVVAEVSSFQLELVDKFKPSIACILNITPDHLNRHRSLDNYRRTKARIFQNQDEEDYLVLNADDKNTSALAEKDLPMRKVLFSLEKKINGFYVQGDFLFDGIRGEKLFSRQKIKLPGKHNRANVLAAVGMARLLGVQLEKLEQITEDFRGLPHTLEYINTIYGVHYVNDSKGTNPQATGSALEAIEGPLVLIAGGQDRGLEYDELARIIADRVKYLILMGENRARFQEAVIKTGFSNIYLVEDMEEAVSTARHLAARGDTVLMSPASPSWDQYSSYVERGERFRYLVLQMEGA